MTKDFKNKCSKKEKEVILEIIHHLLHYITFQKGNWIKFEIPKSLKNIHIKVIYDYQKNKLINNN